MRDGIADFDITTGQHNICNNATLCYFRSIYYILSYITSIGVGDITAMTPIETVFSQVIVISCTILMASIISCVMVLFRYWENNGVLAMKKKLNRIYEYMVTKNYPVKLMEAILASTERQFKLDQGLKESLVLSFITKPLRAEISMYIKNKAFTICKIGARMHPTVQRNIASGMRVLNVDSGDYIYVEGDIAENIYFLTEGKVEVKVSTLVEGKIKEHYDTNARKKTPSRNIKLQLDSILKYENMDFGAKVCIVVWSIEYIYGVCMDAVCGWEYVCMHHFICMECVVNCYLYIHTCIYVVNHNDVRS